MNKILIADDQLGWRNFNEQSVVSVLGTDVIIHKAESAKEAYSMLLENAKEPYDYIFTDMQMENDFTPKMAGEWLIEQIQNIPSYYKTTVIIVSASPKIKYIADSFGVNYIPKPVAGLSLEPYKEILVC